MKVERKNSLKKNQITHLKIKITNFNDCKILNIQELLLNEDNNNQTDLQERIKNANKTYFMLQTLFKNEDMLLLVLCHMCLDSVWNICLQY